MSSPFLDDITFFVPTQVIYGIDSSTRLGPVCADRGFRSALVVIDPGVDRSGAAAAAIDSLTGAGTDVHLWSEVRSNPTDADVMAGLTQYRELLPDVIIGIGGGSAMDTAKGVALLASNGGVIGDYKGNGNVPRRSWPLVLLPTTAGTGSEVSANISITDSGTHEKLAVRDPNAAAMVAILDPTLLRGLPPKAAAAAGMDALTHAVESYVSVRATPYTRMLAREAAALINESLEAFVRDRGNLETAGTMLYGACLAGIAMAHTGTGNAHALARALGGLYGVPHGDACAVALEPVMRFNQQAAVTGYAKLAKAFGEHQAHEGAAVNAQRAVDRVARLRRAVGIPDRFDITPSADELRQLCAWTAANSGPNPRPTDANEAEALVRQVVSQ